MKVLLFFLTLSISLSSFAWNDEYKFDNFKRIDDFDFQQVVSNNKSWSIVIFNHGYCSFPDSMMDCFPFEMKLNSLAPNILALHKNIQIINMDTESTYTYQKFNLKTLPSVVFILNGMIMKTISANKCHPVRNPDCLYRRGHWANELLQKTLNEVYKIPSSVTK